MNHFHQSFRRRVCPRGFTLMELIVVITVVAVLASILVPAAGRVATAAKKRKSVMLFYNITNAMEAYRAEYNHYPIFTELSATTTTSSITQEKDYAFLLGASNNLMRRVLTADSSYLSSVAASGATNYNPRQRRFLVLDDSNITTRSPGTETNPAIVDGFGNTQIGVVVHAGPSRQIDKSSFTQPVSDVDESGMLSPTVVRNLPQPIAIYSLVQPYNNDPLSSVWITTWSYDDYNQ